MTNSNDDNDTDKARSKELKVKSKVSDFNTFKSVKNKSKPADSEISSEEELKKIALKLFVDAFDKAEKPSCFAAIILDGKGMSTFVQSTIPEASMIPLVGALEVYKTGLINSFVDSDVESLY